ncbi:MAG: hypothetical protein KBD78_00560 [Oligoflexales bacterium]|nr:hypothetical protein [Oligoflexales bacterium]
MRSNFFLLCAAAAWLSSLMPCFASDEVLKGIGLPIDGSITNLLGQATQCIPQDSSKEFWGPADQMDQYFQLGHDQGNAIETPNIVKNAIWFSDPSRTIRVCFDNQDKNVKNTDYFEQAFTKAWDIWNSYLNKNTPRVYSFDRSDFDFSEGIINFNWMPRAKVSIAMNYQIMSFCDETIDLRVMIGGNNKEIEMLQQNNNHPVAFTQRKFLERSLTWSKGFIYIAGSSQTIEKRNFSMKLNWQQNKKKLENVFLHEIGHVLGVPHIEGTIMRADLYQRLFLNKWPAYFSNLAIDHQNTLYDDCGANKKLKLKMGFPRLSNENEYDQNLNFLDKVLNAKFNKKAGKNSIDIELNFVQDSFEETPSKSRYKVKRGYNLIFKVRDEFGNESIIEGDLSIDINSQVLTKYQPIFNQLVYYRSGIASPVASIGMKSACHASFIQTGKLKIEGRTFPITIINNAYKSENRTLISINKNKVRSGLNIRIDYGVDIAEFELAEVLQ